MALNWDDLVNSRRLYSSKPSWDDLVNSRRNYGNQSIYYGNAIPSGYEGTEYEGMTNDEIVQRVAEKQKYYDEEEKQRRQNEQLKKELQEKAMRDAERAREEQRKKEEQATKDAINKVIQKSTEMGVSTDNPENPSTAKREDTKKAIYESGKEIKPIVTNEYIEKPWYADAKPGDVYFEEGDMNWEKPVEIRQKGFWDDVRKIGEEIVVGGLFQGTNTALEYVNKFFNNLTGSDFELANYSKISEDVRKNSYQNLQNLENPIAKKIGELSPSIGQSALGLMYTAITGNPKIGATVFGLSAAGGYYEQAKEMGLDEDKSLLYGGILGGFEGLTEDILTHERLSQFKHFQSKEWQKAFNSIGVGVTENFLQEAVMEPIQEATAQIVGGKEYANWDNIWGRMFQAGIDGALMEILLDGASSSLSTPLVIANKIQNNEKITAKDVTSLVNEAEKANINVGQIIKDSFRAATELAKNEVQGKEMIAVTQWENNQPNGGEVMKGNRINTSNKLNADVAIVRTNNGYTAVDTNTGIQLDTEKPTQAEAIESVRNKIKNLDKQSVKQINDRLWLAQTKIQAEINRFKAEENADNVLKSTQANEVGDTVIKENETTNNMSQQNKTAENNPDASIFANSSGKSKVENSDLANSLFDNNKQYKADDIQDYYYDNDELISTTDENYIDIKKVTQNNKDYIEVGEYNENDELVDREYIPVDNNGNVSGSALNDAIRGLTTDTSNAPINGQMDIEGNQVKAAAPKQEVEAKIQGLEDYSRKEIKSIVNNYIQEKLIDNGIDGIEIKDSEIIGSRNRGNAKKSSDLDVVVEYSGDYSEDALFDVLNEDPLEIDGIKIDINPITADKTGTLKEYLQRSNEYDQNFSSNKNGMALNDYEQKTKNTILSNDRNVIIENKNHLKELVIEALNSQSNKALHLGKLTEQQTDRIKKSINNLPKDKQGLLKRKDYDVVINQSEIRHLRDKKQRLTENDIIDYVNKIPEIISNFDEVYYSKNNKDEGIKFAKKINDAKYYSFTLVSNKKGTLNVKSTSMSKADYENKKRGLSPTNDGKKLPPDKTSKTNGASTSNINNSVPQKQENVKQNTITNNSMQPKTNNTQDVRTMPKNTTNISDFGEKIGGARKDTAILTGKRTSREVIHDYRAEQTENGYAVNFRNRVLKDGFKTQEEAEKYILDFKDSIKSNLAFVEEGKTRDGEDIYVIKIRNPKTLRSSYTTKSFKNKQDAESYAIALSMYLKDHNKFLFRPTIQKVERINANSKNATKATGDNILKEFGFRGGEFGNWVNQTERQQFLNYAQDAFTDLAEALGIDPSSLGQKGAMGIAFGARGSGLTGAVAHFEPNKKVINMTRLKGAGSLAHEYGHSIDNFLSREGGYDLNGMATKNWRNPKLSDKVQTAIKQIKDLMDYSVSTDETEIAKKNKIFEKNRLESLKFHMGYMNRVFNGEASDYKYNRKTKQRENIKIEVTKEQKAKYDSIKKILEDGKLEPKRTFVGDALSSKNYEYAKPLEDLKELYKEVVGRKIDDDTLYWLYRYGQQSKQLTEIKSESAYKKSAIELDKAFGRATPYYSTEVEMWARAFESYIHDILKEKGITDTYLVHSVNNSDYALFNPYPAGEERQSLNKAFDNLINIMKEEGMFKLKAETAKKETTAKVAKDDGVRYMKKPSKKSNQVKESKHALEQKFKELTGDSILRAEARLAGIELRNYVKEAKNLPGELEQSPYSKEAMEIYKKHENSKKSSSYLYHSTATENLQNILEKGLTTGNKQNQEGVSAKDKIYLAATEELAQSFAKQDNVTLRINPKMYSQLENLETDLLGGEGSYSITNNIPPEMLQVKENGKWVNLKESKIGQETRLAVKTEENEPGKTNAERTDSYIEQEIQRLEKTGSWDNSIPVTRRSDIRKTIEDYLGLGIKRGRFRQNAYGIYKTNRDLYHFTRNWTRIRYWKKVAN